MLRSEKHIVIVGLLITFMSPTADAASDPRFFGTYCGAYVYRIKAPVPKPPFGIPVIETIGLNTSIKVHVRYRETARRNGLAHGSGTITVSGSPHRFFQRRGISSGDQYPFVFSGKVAGPSRLKGSGVGLGTLSTKAGAILSADGNTLAISVMEQDLELFKDQCGNDAPTAEITTIRDSFPWGRPNALHGRGQDAEDVSIPNERKIWTSNRDASWRKNGNTASLQSLLPGTHKITFAVIDSGGRRARATKVILIENRPPTVQILSPRDDDTVYAGQRIPFEGEAVDPETGRLTNVEGALVWTLNSDTPIGTGKSVVRVLTPGVHQITLTVSDGADTARDSINITARPCPLGSCPPDVSIKQPDRYQAIGNGPDDCMALEVGVAFDVEDGELDGGSVVWTDLIEGAAEPVVLEPTGRSILHCGFEAGVTDTKHTITVSATDSDHATASASQTIYVIPIAGGPY